MKNNFKRILAFVLGFLMFLFPAPRASAQIEVVEFSDESRLIRFTKSDLQNMVDWYHSVVTSCIVKRGPVIPGESVTCAGTADDPGSCDRGLADCGILGGIGMVVSGVPLCVFAFMFDMGTVLRLLIGFLGITFVVIGVGCCVSRNSARERVNEITRVSAKPGESWLGPQDILTTMIRQNVAVGASESQPLLHGSMQGVPGCFLLLERRKDKASTEPRPFFTTDRDTNFTQSLRNNRFARLIRDVRNELSTKGVRIKNRYCLTRANTQFIEVPDPNVMPELDIVDVVVDGADEDAA